MCYCVSCWWCVLGIIFYYYYILYTILLLLYYYIILIIYYTLLFLWSIFHHSPLLFCSPHSLPNHLIHSILVGSYIRLLIFSSVHPPSSNKTHPHVLFVWLVEVCGGEVYRVFHVLSWCDGFELVLTLGVIYYILLYYIILHIIHYTYIIYYILYITIILLLYYILYSSSFSSSPLPLSIPPPPLLLSSFLINIPHPILLIHSILVDTYIYLTIFLPNHSHLFGFGWNTVEYLTITPKHQFSSDLDEIQSNTLQSLLFISSLPSQSSFIPTHHLNHSILVGIYLCLLIFHPLLSTNNLTPHVLSGWRGWGVFHVLSWCWR